MGPLVADTNVVIYLLSGRLVNPVSGPDVFVSVGTEIVLLSFPSLTSGAESQIRRFLTLAQTFPISEEIKVEAIRLKRTTSLKLADAVIAATAIVSNAQLLTHDRKLHGIPGLTASAPPLR
jgi:predicted nucleic acid-binding protein